MAAVTIEQLGSDGAYRPAATSRFLHVRPDEVARWLTDGQAANRRNWVRRLREWARDVLRPRTGGENGTPCHRLAIGPIHHAWASRARPPDFSRIDRQRGPPTGGG